MIRLALGRISNPFRHIKRAGGKRSGLETQIGASLLAIGAAVKGEKEIPAIEYSELRPKKYHPDFQLSNGIYIEAKGWFKPADRSKHLCIKHQHPELDIRFVFSNPKEKLNKGSHTTYAEWCDKHGFRWCEKVVPLMWIREQKPCQHKNTSRYTRDYDNPYYECSDCGKEVG